ncbi:MAG: YggS family pyridoxal phosphate-dependent enzyme [Gemmataceae bacterium]
MDAEQEKRLAENLATVRGRIANACRRVGRDPASVRLIGVTKYVDSETAAALHNAGLADLAESRPQELRQKAPATPNTIRWHLIGHLQRNKVDKTLPFAGLIHSVDSVRLLEAIDAAATKLSRTAKVLLEVNMSGEAAKHGFAPREIAAVAETLQRLTHVEVQGFMTMAALEEPEAARSAFASLKKLRDKMSKLWDQPLPELSMGMSNDFEVAIEEGATMVRVGSALFEGII